MDSHPHEFKIDKYHYRILHYLSSSDGPKQPCELWKDRVITNRNLLYRKIKELVDHGKIKMEEDAKDHRRIWLVSITVIQNRSYVVGNVTF